jgi:CheY-like chemotaxis protein
VAKANPTILLADQSPQLLALNELILADAGFDTVAVPPGKDPVEEAAHLHPAVAVVRVAPFTPNAWDVIDRLQAGPETSAIPLVVLSTAEDLALEARAAPNVRGTVVAPFDISALQDAVRTALGQPPPAAVLPPPSLQPSPAVLNASRLLMQGSRTIVLWTMRRLQQTGPYRGRFGELTPGLIDDVPEILGAIVTGLQRNLSPETLLATPEIRQTSHNHVALRLSQGLGLPAMSEEYLTMTAEMLRFLRDSPRETGFAVADAFDVAEKITGYVSAWLCLAIQQALAVQSSCAGPSGRAAKRS